MSVDDSSLKELAWAIEVTRTLVKVRSAIGDIQLEIDKIEDRLTTESEVSSRARQLVTLAADLAQTSAQLDNLRQWGAM